MPESSNRAAAAAESPTTDPESRSQAFGHVASAVVHSVINHFSAIVSQAEMLKSRRPGPDEVTERADAIIRAALGGAGMARRLSDYARGVMGTELVPLDLDALLADRVRARRHAAPKGVDVLADLNARAIFPGDASKLSMMLDCLIDNAFEALTENEGGGGGGNGGVVVVSTRIDPRGWLELDVRDDGPGMTPDVLEFALEPFFTTRDDHAGVGLPLARSLWRRHRGAFSIDAPHGRGTLVRLTRPPA